MKSIPSTRHLYLGTVTLMSVEKSGEGLLIFLKCLSGGSAIYLNFLTRLNRFSFILKNNGIFKYYFLSLLKSCSKEFGKKCYIKLWESITISQLFFNISNIYLVLMFLKIIFNHLRQSFSSWQA